MWPEAASPATVFTSIGKKVMMTTTAAFECQSKPNHMTMIGATPMIGSAETMIADRQQARAAGTARGRPGSPRGSPSEQPSA